MSEGERGPDGEGQAGAERAEIARIVAELRGSGFLVRMTEWTEGFQCGAVLRADTRVAFFSAWRRSDLEAWQEVRSLAAAGERPSAR